MNLIVKCYLFMSLKCFYVPKAWDALHDFRLSQNFWFAMIVAENRAVCLGL